MISPATVRMTTCRNVKPNKIESLRSTFAGTRARIGASVSRRAISPHPFPSGRVRRGGDGGTGGDGAGRGARAGGDGWDGAGDGAGARRADADTRGDGGDGGSTRRGRAGTAGTDLAGGDPARAARVPPPGAGRAGAENTGVTGAGGRFGAVCGRDAAEKLAAGAAPAGRLDAAGVAALLNCTGAEGPAGAGVA